MKSINKTEIVEEYMAYGVEYSIGDEHGFITECDDEEEARLYAAVMDGTIVAKVIFESAWGAI